MINAPEERAVLYTYSTPRHLAQRALERHDDQPLDIRGRRAGPGRVHVDHRHDDLRLLLARRRDDGQQPEQQRGQHQDRRQLVVDEGAGDAPGEAGVHGHLAPTRVPSARSAGGSTTIDSPGVRPLATTTAC